MFCRSSTITLLIEILKQVMKPRIASDYSVKIFILKIARTIEFKYLADFILSS